MRLSRHNLVLRVLVLAGTLFHSITSIDFGLGKSQPIPGSPDITELNAVNFNTTLLQLRPNQNALIEFYASWCPHCRHFAPEYKRAAAYLSRLPELKPLFMGRIDCAVEVKACSFYKIDGYPSLLLATVQQFVNASTDKFQKFPLKFHKTAAANVVEWLGTALNKTLPELTGSWQIPGEANDTAGSDAAKSGGNATTWDVQDVERATMMMMQQSAEFLKGSEARAALQDLLAVWVTSHPSSRCMAGAEKLKQQLPRIWPAKSESPGVELRSFHICEDVEEVEWSSCKGSGPQFRGYTCGLWTMWHTISVRLPEEDGGRLLFSALKAFAAHFFQCEVCRTHFSQLLAQAETEQIFSRHDAVMWLWRTHNAVNKRLADEEKSTGSGDAAFPKQQFPSKDLCGPCSQEGAKGRKELTPTWDQEEVEKFLFSHYGPGSSRPAPEPEADPPADVASETVQNEVKSDPTTQELVLGQGGQTNRPQTWAGKRYSSQLQTILAIAAMGLIMAWYCLSARGHKELAASREAAALMRQQLDHGTAVGKRKARVGVKPLR